MRDLARLPKAHLHVHLESTVRARHGIGCRLILDHPRRHPVGRAVETLRLARRYAPDGVIGIGLAGAEAYPMAPFGPVCAAARAAGLRLIHHAGESAAPASIREALAVGLADRIGHGVRALDDAGLVAVLRRRGIALEMSLSSNVALGLVPSWAEHPLPALARAMAELARAAVDASFAPTELVRRMHRGIDAWLDDDQPDPNPEEHR